MMQHRRLIGMFNIVVLNTPTAQSQLTVAVSFRCKIFKAAQ